MSARWFRFYDEVLNDPKVQKLSGDDFKAWVNVLCLASQNDGALPSVEDIGFALRMDADGVRTLVERLLNATLIDKCSGGPDGYHYAPHGWGKRQYKSDSSTDRVKRYRERSKTVSETSPDTDTDTDTPLAPKGAKRISLPDDFKLPPAGKLSGDAGTCAKQWTAASYQAQGQSFVNGARASNNRKTDWVLAWESHVIKIHAQVLRDEKQGNAPKPKPDPAKPERKITPEHCDKQAAFYTKLEQMNTAEEWEKRGKRLRAKLKKAEQPA